MFRNIVTGVDGSETAEHAARQAAELATAVNAELHILSAYGSAESRSQSDRLNKITINFREDAERVASEAVADLKSRYSDLTITGSAAEGKPADALVTRSDQLENALIVVGNKRVQGPVRFLGSIARSVAANASCDLYIVNTHQR